MTSHPQAGFIALTSIIIVSLLLITVTVVAAQGSYSSRLDQAAYENKYASTAAAYACEQYALARLSEHAGYSGGEFGVRIGPETCSVVSVTSPTTDTRIILVQATIRRSVTNLKFTVHVPDWTLLLREELADRGS